MLEVVEDAFEEIAVKTAETPLTNDELQAGIRRCNRMLVAWADIGTIQGYNPVLNGSDTIDIQPEAEDAVIANLALKLAPSFSKPLTQALVAFAGDSLDRLRASNSIVGEVAFPDTLPIGSGNQCPDINTDRRFFNQNKTENF
jgi:hypothetical protein